MKTLAQTSAVVNPLTLTRPIAEVVADFNTINFRFAQIHANETGKVVLHRNQRGSLVLQHFPKALPAPSVMPLTLQHRDGTICSDAQAEAWLNEVAILMGEVEAEDVTPVDVYVEVATGLIAEYGHDFDGRIERALELVKAGQIDFPHYQTSYDPSGLYGLRSCRCGDAQHRSLPAKFGVACKHTLAQEISHQAEAQQERVGQRKLNDLVDGKRSRAEALPASVDNQGSIEDFLGYEPDSKPAISSAAMAALRQMEADTDQALADGWHWAKPDPTNLRRGMFRSMSNPNGYRS